MNKDFYEKPKRRLYEQTFEFIIPLEFNACVDRLREFVTRSSVQLYGEYDETTHQTSFTLTVLDVRYKRLPEVMRLKGMMYPIDDNTTHFSLTVAACWYRWDDDTAVKFYMISLASGIGLLLIFSVYPALCNGSFLLITLLLYSVIILLHIWRNETRKVRQFIDQLQRSLLFQ